MLLDERDADRAETTRSERAPAAAPSLAGTGAAKLTPTAAWSRRVRRVGGLIQLSFAAFWLVRGSVVVGGAVSAVLIAVSSVAVIAGFAYAVKATAGTAPRPRSPEGTRIERAITLATVIEFAAAFALPVIVSSAGHSDWVLPSIAITIGPLLLYLDRLVHIPRYRPVGWVLTVGPVVLVGAMSGTPLIATTGIAAGVLLLGTALAGFHDLAATPTSSQEGPTSWPASNPTSPPAKTPLATSAARTAPAPGSDRL